MFVWPAYPFIRFTLAFCIGILAYHQWMNSLNISNINLIVSSCALAIVLFFFHKFRVLKSSWIQGSALLFIFALFGIIRSNEYDQSESKQYSTELFANTSSYTAVVTSYPVHKGKNYAYEVETKHLKLPDTVIEHNQNVKLYIASSAPNSPLQYGDLINIKKKPFEIEGPSNPHEFDYANYMALSNIFFQSFSDTSSLNVLTHYQGNPIMSTVYRWRAYFESSIMSAVNDQDAQGIALALLLGIKDRLDTDTKNAYAAAGAMHVLAVSGLHIGIIHFIISFFFKHIKSKSFQRHIVPLISILLLWIYALITGFSPSIVRAATMFSIVLYGKTLNRSPNIFNSIFLSAFILLVCNPNQLYAVGFQLSYLAVLGIVYLFPLLNKLYTPRYWLIRKAWEITCISLVAQLATFPLSLTYFHQFPSYFLLSNLVVIPMAFVIMSLGIAQLTLGWMPLFSWLKYLLTYALKSLNWVTFRIEALSGSIIDWVNLTVFDSLSIYVFILLILAFLHSKRYTWLTWAMICSLVFSIQKSYDILTRLNTHELIIYDIKGQIVMEEINGLHSLLSSNTKSDDLELLAYQINPNKLRSYLDPMTAPALFDSSYLIESNLYFYYFAGKRLLFVMNGEHLAQINFPIDTDYLFIDNNSISELPHINSLFNYDQLILTQNNNYWTTKKLKKQAESMDSTLKITKGKYWSMRATNEPEILGWSF